MHTYVVKAETCQRAISFAGIAGRGEGTVRPDVKKAFLFTMKTSHVDLFQK